jgi:dTDP-4-dehydrorhamnose reductase
MDNTVIAYIDSIIARDDITDKLRDTAIATKEGKVSRVEFARAVCHELNKAPEVDREEQEQTY